MNDLEYTSDSRGKLFNITLKKRIAMVANSPKNLAHVRPRNSMPFTPRPINYTPHNPDAQKAFNLQFRSRISPIRRQILVTQSPQFKRASIAKHEFSQERAYIDPAVKEKNLTNVASSP